MASFARMGEEVSVAPAPIPQREQDWAARLEKTIERGANHLLSIQAEEGFWQGELEADTTLESDYIYYLYVLGKADPERIAKLANYIRRRQLADGGWSIYPGGPSELNATCKAYFALKLAGDSTEARHMVQAREIVHRLGGLEHTNSYVRFYLALVGAVGWELVPSIPPEFMLLPNWFYFNIYEMSSWTRGIVIPMAILSSLRPDWRLPERARVDERRERLLCRDEDLPARGVEPHHALVGAGNQAGIARPARRSLDRIARDDIRCGQPGYRRGRQRGEPADHQRDTASHQAAHQQVAARFISTEQMPICKRWRGTHHVPVRGIEGVRQQHRADRAGQRDQQQHNRPSGNVQD